MTQLPNYLKVSKSDILFLALLAAVPIQLGKFFFVDSSYVLGIPIDYRAVSIYFSDIIIIFYLLAAAVENRRNFKKIFKSTKPQILALAVFSSYLIVTSLLYSTSPGASLWFSAKIVVFSVLAIFAATAFAKISLAKSASRVIQFSLLWQGILIGFQFLFQRSIGLWFLGERAFDVSTTGIAHIAIYGREFLRPYGTFPHPNVAAAYLVLSLIIIMPVLLTTIVTSLAIVLTWSKTSLVLLALTLGARSNQLRSRLIQIAAVVLLILLLPRVITASINSIAERLILTQAALDIAISSPIVGVGSNNFILELSKLDLFSLAETRLLQPVHNVFLLILAENGIIGLILFTIVLLTFASRVKGPTKTLLFIGLLIYASIDHFFWTLHQGQLLFWLTLAYIVGNRRKNPI